MADKATPILNAHDRPGVTANVEQVITLFRIALAPWLNADIENIPQHQSEILTASAMFAGMTVGHMLGVGALNASKGDRDQAKLVAMQAFDSGVEMGLREARDAMLRQKRGGRA